MIEKKQVVQKEERAVIVGVITKEQTERQVNEFLDELDKIVLSYGGRLYLSKDARMKSEIFWEGYSNAQKFSDLVKKFNPSFKINSIQARRLNITQ